MIPSDPPPQSWCARFIPFWTWLGKITCMSDYFFSIWDSRVWTHIAAHQVHHIWVFSSPPMCWDQVFQSLLVQRMTAFPWALQQGGFHHHFLNGDGDPFEGHRNSVDNSESELRKKKESIVTCQYCLWLHLNLLSNLKLFPYWHALCLPGPTTTSFLQYSFPMVFWICCFIDEIYQEMSWKV